MTDPIAQLKAAQRAAWAGFAVLESVTATAAPRLVRFAGVERGARLLDVACGTGVVALSAARLGARSTGVDLTPELVARAKENAGLMGVEATFVEGDVEALPLPDDSFDVVVSQFGHMFAPRPAAAVGEMLRVLRPGGTLAFSTWPPDLMTGRFIALGNRYAPPPPVAIPSPLEWGEPAVVRQHLGDAVRDLTFATDAMFFQALSPAHYRLFMESQFGPMARVVKELDQTAPERAATLRAEIEAVVAPYFADNRVRQDFLMTRAIKR